MSLHQDIRSEGAQTRPPHPRVRRLLHRAFLVSASVGTLACGGGDLTLRSPGLSLTLSPQDGHVLSLLDGKGQQRAGHPTDSLGLWVLDIGADSARHTLAAAAAKKFTARRVSGDSLALEWGEFPAPYGRLSVTASVALHADSTTAWHIALGGIDSTDVEQVHFPRLTGIVVQDGDELAVPSWMGQRARHPRTMLAGPEGKGRRLEFAYPGATSMQMMALSHPERGGLYFAADDSAAYRKSFTLRGEGGGDTATYAMVHVLSDPGTNASYAPSYRAIIGIVPGDWFSAIERYRQWGTKQYWARESRLHSGVTPEWMRDAGAWEWNRGRSNVVLEPAAVLQKDVGLPVNVFWHWWHHGPYDTSFPDYIPPREGAPAFTAAVSKAHAAGLHAIVYMNQRLWCTNTPSWSKEGAEQWAVRERNGTVRLETYNVFNPLPCATMNPHDAFWRNKYVGIADTVLNQYGIDGIYMDQAVLSLIDWTPGHDHPVGGGNYWMQGFRELAKNLRERGGAGRGFAGEGGGESWLPDLDAFLTLQVSQERYADPASGWEVVPMFQAAYHPYALTYGTYGSLTLPPYDELWPKEKRPATAMQLLDEKFVRQFHLEQARMFVWGMQPTIANFLPDQLTARRREMDYFGRLARLRYGLREFFQTGEFLRAPKVQVPEVDLLLSRISIYAARLGGPTEAHIMTPEVLSGAWRAADGRVAVALAGINLEPVEAKVTIDPALWGLPANTRIVRRDSNGTQELGTLKGGAQEITVPVGVLEGVVLELVPPA